MIILKKITPIIDYLTKSEFSTYSGTLQNQITDNLDLITTMSGAGNITVVYDDVGGAITISGAGGVTDHGDLTGLSNDDHPQYHTDARGDARYYRINFETLTLDGDDIDHKYIDLSVAPKTDDSVDLHVYGGLKGLKDYDYTVSGTKISWDSKDWDGILEVGDIIEVICYY